MVILHSDFGFVQYYHHSWYYNSSYLILPLAIIPFYLFPKAQADLDHEGHSSVLLHCTI